jgi:hypothetical protein
LALHCRSLCLIDSGVLGEAAPDQTEAAPVDDRSKNLPIPDPILSSILALRRCISLQ